MYIWSQWPRGLRRGSAAARLLGLWFRIPPGAWMFVVGVVCCQVEVSATGWSLVQRSEEAMARVGPQRQKKIKNKNIFLYLFYMYIIKCCVDWSKIIVIYLSVLYNLLLPVTSRSILRTTSLFDLQSLAYMFQADFMLEEKHERLLFNWWRHLNVYFHWQKIHAYPAGRAV